MPCLPGTVRRSYPPRSRPSNLLKGKPPEPGEGRKAGSRRPLLRKRPPLGSGEVTRKFACASPSKAGLCPWPRVTGSDCGRGILRKYFPESWISCRKSASALRAVRKERHPEMPLARSRPGSRPSGGFVAHLAFDHQMTPTLFAGAFRAFGPFAPLTGGSAVGHAFGGPPT